MLHRRLRCRRGLAELALALAAVTWESSARADETTPSTADGGAPWGVQLEPGAVPLLPRRPAVKATNPLGGALVPPTSTAGWTPERASTITPPGQQAFGAATPVAPDAVYLDELSPPASPEVRTASLNTQTVAPTGEILAEPQAKLPPGARDGVFQKIYGTATYLPAIGNEPDTLGWGDFEAGVVFGFPFLRRDTPLLVTPFAGGHLLDNAGPLDIPSTLYDAAVEFRHLRKFGDGPWAMDVAATVGYYSDFEQSSSDAVRVSGRGLGVYESSPEAKWILGVAYLNRAGATVMPVGGVIWQPNPDAKYELVFPRPRLYRRLAGSTERDERWVYVGGEFGGGVWSITRPSTGDLDLLSYSDVRVLVGYERKRLLGLSPRAEFGYVFARKLEYRSATLDVSLDDTIFARAGLSF